MIKEIFKGESCTLMFTFPEAYEMERINSHKVYIGIQNYDGVVDGQSIMLKLKSSDTDKLCGVQKVVLWFDDSTLGLRKPYCGDLVITKTKAEADNESESDIYDIIIPIVISETSVTVGDILYNYIKGANGLNGRGISNLELISTVGLIKTYRITYTDSTTFEYSVSDGRGIIENGVVRTSGNGAPGTTDTYTITFTDSTTTTFTVVNGANGTEAPVVQTTGTSETDVMSQKAVSNEINRIDSFIYQDIKFPLDRNLTGYSIYIDGSYWFESEDWFDGAERVLYSVTIGSAGAGVVGVALFTISGTTATLYSSKELPVAGGINVFLSSQITDIEPIVGTRYYVAFKKISGTATIGVKSDNSGKGRNIPVANPTLVNTNNYSVSYYLTIRNEILTNTINYDFAEEVAKKDIIFIPAGTHNISAKITLRSGQKIYGVSGKSILKFNTTSLTNCIEIDGVENVILSDFKIEGSDSNTVMNGSIVGASVLPNFADAISKTSMGTHIGIYINNSKGVGIRNLEVSNFNGCGIILKKYGNVLPNTSKLTDVYVHDCYAGYIFEQEGEYNTITSIHATRNQIGVIVDAGNNSFTGCNITWNRVNWLFLGGVNNAHGSVTGGTHNHASLAGFIFNEVSYGEIISGSNIWYAPIYVKNSKGIVFDGCVIGTSPIYADGNSVGGGMWMVTDCIFNGGSSVTHNYNSNASNLKLKNNWWMSGEDNRYINN